MTINYSSILKEFFEEIKAGNIYERNVGLCWNFEHFCTLRGLFDYYYELECAKGILRNIMRNFPKYTGDPAYTLVAEDDYDAHQVAGVDFYDSATSYGAIRLEFVDWALKELAQNRVSYMQS